MDNLATLFAGTDAAGALSLTAAQAGAALSGQAFGGPANTTPPTGDGQPAPLFIDALQQAIQNGSQETSVSSLATAVDIPLPVDLPDGGNVLTSQQPDFVAPIDRLRQLLSVSTLQNAKAEAAVDAVAGEKNLIDPSNPLHKQASPEQESALPVDVGQSTRQHPSDPLQLRHQSTRLSRLTSQVDSQQGDTVSELWLFSAWQFSADLSPQNVRQPPGESVETVHGQVLTQDAGEPSIEGNSDQSPASAQRIPMLVDTGKQDIPSTTTETSPVAETNSNALTGNRAAPTTTTIRPASPTTITTAIRTTNSESIPPNAGPSNEGDVESRVDDEPRAARDSFATQQVADEHVAKDPALSQRTRPEPPAQAKPLEAPVELPVLQSRNSANEDIRQLAQITEAASRTAAAARPIHVDIRQRPAVRVDRNGSPHSSNRVVSNSPAATTPEIPNMPETPITREVVDKINLPTEYSEIDNRAIATEQSADENFGSSVVPTDTKVKAAPEAGRKTESTSGTDRVPEGVIRNPATPQSVEAETLSESESLQSEAHQIEPNRIESRGELFGLPAPDQSATPQPRENSRPVTTSGLKRPAQVRPTAQRHTPSPSPADGQAQAQMRADLQTFEFMRTETASAPQGTSAARVSVPDQIAETVASHFKTVGSPGGNEIQATEMRIKLYPEELGEVTLLLDQTGQRRTAAVLVGSEAVQQLVEAGIEQVEGTLRELGFDSVDVGLADRHAQQRFNGRQHEQGAERNAPDSHQHKDDSRGEQTTESTIKDGRVDTTA